MFSPVQETVPVLLLTKTPRRFDVEFGPVEFGVRGLSQPVEVVEPHRPQSRLVFLGDRVGLGAVALLAGGVGRRLQQREDAAGDDREDQRADQDLDQHEAPFPRGSVAPAQMSWFSIGDRGEGL